MGSAIFSAASSAGPPLLRSGAKAVFRETLRTDGKILNDIAERKLIYATTAGDIVLKHLPESTQNFVSKLSGRGRKSVRGAGGKKSGSTGPKNQNMNRAQKKFIKRDTFPSSTSVTF